MTLKYKLLMGGVDDFDGAHHEDTHAFVHNKNGWVTFTNDPKTISKDLFTLVAHREPIASEQDLNDCIGAPEADATEQLLTERGSRYGKFKDGAEIMQELKDVMREVDGWHNLTPSQREALDMIQHKIGRILNGDPTYDDSWKDIAGYATLIVNELNGEIK